MKIASRILRSFCPDHLYEEIEGDLIQTFNRLHPAKSKAKIVVECDSVFQTRDFI